VELSLRAGIARRQRNRVAVFGRDARIEVAANGHASSEATPSS